MMMDLFVGKAWAQAGGGPAAGPQIFQMVLMMSLFIGIYYFIVLRPQNQQQQRHQQMLASLKKGDMVVTSSGLHGKVAEVEAQTVVLDVDKGTRLRWDKGRIARILGAGAESAEGEKK
jgi:preprotein translocase subunit YajC